MLDRAPDAQVELVEIERLLEEVERARAHRAHGGVDAAERRQQQHARALVARARRLEHREAVGARQAQIGHHDVVGLVIADRRAGARPRRPSPSSSA